MQDLDKLSNLFNIINDCLKEVQAENQLYMKCFKISGLIVHMFLNILKQLTVSRPLTPTSIKTLDVYVKLDI